MFGELFHAVVKFSLLEIYKVSVGGFPFLPPNGFPPATFLSLTPYNPPYPVKKHKRHCVFPLYEELFFFPDKSGRRPFLGAHTCAYVLTHERTHATHPSTNVCTLANAYAPIRERALRKAANVIEAEKLTKHEMETQERQDPRLEALALKMQSVCYDLGQRVISEQLDIKQLIVGDGNGFSLKLEDNRPDLNRMAVKEHTTHVEDETTNFQMLPPQLRLLFEEFARVADDYVISAREYGYDGSEFSVTTSSGIRVTVKK